MGDELCLKAYAKVNIGLRVLPRRKDGFHDIESVFQTISLADELVLRSMPGSKSCKITCDRMVLPEKNTLTTAYEAFASVTKIEPMAVSVMLKKHIPAGGGLGGGSSDAAAFVRGLETLHGFSLSDAQKDKVASVVGSDVFFFLHTDGQNNGCALVSGRGERVQMIGRRSDLHFVLVFPKVSCSTKEAYALVDSKKDWTNSDYPSLQELFGIYKSSALSWPLKNDFSDVMANGFPEIQESIDAVRSCGADYVQMSGSGSTVFGVFSSCAGAENALGLLKSKGFECAYAC